ncbi:MAG TPA: M28 family peptidase [Ktedonobacterales bacterium]
MTEVRTLARAGVPALTVVALLTLALAWGAPRSSARAAADKALSVPDIGFPAIDPEYLYTQLNTMVTAYQSREAGYDTAQSSPTTGHDGFASYWQAEMLRNLAGFGASASRDSLTIPGWQGRPATSPAFNVEVTVPGVQHPEQVVVIGCHYDGEASSTQSANDDGSGCAIELAVARALSQYWTAHHLYPARTLRFVIFDAEEQGLYGSFHYVNQTVNGDLGHIALMINEEQNGIEYPLRFLGKMSNPLLPTTIFMTPLSNNEVYQDTGSFTASQIDAITRFRGLEKGAAPAVFAAFRALGYTSLTYRDDHNQSVRQPVFTQADLSHISQQDDTIASSDQYPFSLSGIPTATYIGNYSYYDQSPPPWSYPYDQPQDTIQLMNVFASGTGAPSPALKLALALPGMLTTWTLAQPQALGFVTAPGGPVAAIGDIGATQPGQEVALTAQGGYDPAHSSETLSYKWSFGDGATASGAQVRHTWATPGDYTVKLTVTDAAGSRVVSKSVQVASQAPNVSNPYIRYPQDGVPPANPNVTLPVATSANSNGATGGATRRTTNTRQGVTGWVWIAGLALLVALGGLFVAIWLIRRRATPPPESPGGMGEERAARARREQALQDLLRPPDDHLRE